MAAGEMIAVVLEQLKEYDNSDEWEPDDDLILKLKELATDSHKFRAKKDRKTQRSVFRDIIRYVEVVTIFHVFEVMTCSFCCLLMHTLF